MFTIVLLSCQPNDTLSSKSSEAIEDSSNTSDSTNENGGNNCQSSGSNGNENGGNNGQSSGSNGNDNSPTWKRPFCKSLGYTSTAVIDGETYTSQETCTWDGLTQDCEVGPTSTTSV